MQNAVAVTVTVTQNRHLSGSGILGCGKKEGRTTFYLDGHGSPWIGRKKSALVAVVAEAASV